MERKIIIRILALTSVMLAILGVLFIYEISLIRTLKPVKQTYTNPSSVSSESAKPVEITGPGGCVGLAQCLQYCQDNPDVCAKK